MSSSIDSGFRKVSFTAVAAIMAMSFLAACEKGFYVKDSKIAAPDFQVTTQEVDGSINSKISYAFDLKSLIVTEDERAATTENLDLSLEARDQRAAERAKAALAEAQARANLDMSLEARDERAAIRAKAEAEVKAAEAAAAASLDMSLEARDDRAALRAAGEDMRSWTGVLEFSVANKTTMQDRVIQLSAQAVTGKNTTGTIETNAGEPTMTWNARCEGASCARFYLAIMMNFVDGQGTLQDTRILTIGWYRDLHQLKRAMFKHDGVTKTLTDYIKDLELQQPEETVIPSENAEGDASSDERLTLAPANESLQTFDVSFDEHMVSTPSANAKSDQ